MENISSAESSESSQPKSVYEILHSLREGETFVIGDREYTISKVEDGSELGKQFGLNLERNVPVYHLKGLSSNLQGGYHPEADIIVIFENNTDLSTLEHELIHAVELRFEPTPGLLALYERAKHVITEKSFDGDLLSFNFMKNIHEFIADGRTKLKPVLQKEGLWEDFQTETAYMFT